MNISVALCTFNGARYLHEQLSSISRQVRRPDEVVICDDGSTDSTIPILEEFRDSVGFPVRIFRNETNLGVSSNFARCISQCTGDVIFLSDQDDIWLPDRLSIGEREFLDDASIGFIFGDAELIDEQSRPMGISILGRKIFPRRMLKYLEKGCLDRVLVVGNVVTGATMAFRRSYLNLILPIPSGWVHDEWIAVLLAFVAPGRIVKNPIYYREHSDQQIGVGSRNLKTIWGFALARDSFTYRQQYVKAQEVRRRLTEGGVLSNSSQLLLEQYTSFVRDRIKMHEDGPRAFLLGANAFFSGRYFEYAAGFHSWLKDIFLMFRRSRLTQ